MLSSKNGGVSLRTPSPAAPTDTSACGACQLLDPLSSSSISCNKCTHQKEFAPTLNRFNILSRLEEPSTQTKWPIDYVKSENGAKRRRRRRGGRRSVAKEKIAKKSEEQKSEDGLGDLCKRVATLRIKDDDAKSETPGKFIDNGMARLWNDIEAPPIGRRYSRLWQVGSKLQQHSQRLADKAVKLVDIDLPQQPQPCLTQMNDLAFSTEDDSHRKARPRSLGSANPPPPYQGYRTSTTLSTLTPSAQTYNDKSTMTSSDPISSEVPTSSSAIPLPHFNATTPPLLSLPATSFSATLPTGIALSPLLHLAATPASHNLKSRSHPIVSRLSISRALSSKRSRPVSPVSPPELPGPPRAPSRRPRSPPISPLVTPWSRHKCPNNSPSPLPCTPCSPPGVCHMGITIDDFLSRGHSRTCWCSHHKFCSRRPRSPKATADTGLSVPLKYISFPRKDKEFNPTPEKHTDSSSLLVSPSTPQSEMDFVQLSQVGSIVTPIEEDDEWAFVSPPPRYEKPNILRALSAESISTISLAQHPSPPPWNPPDQAPVLTPGYGNLDTDMGEVDHDPRPFPELDLGKEGCL